MHGLTTFSLKQGKTLAAVKNFMQYTKVRHRHEA